MYFLLKWKVWRIERAIRQVIRSAGVKPIVWSFGAYYIDPKHLVFVVGVTSDSERNRLRTDPSFMESLQNLLVHFNWPVVARKYIYFDIESQETVDRENDGNWWFHYK